MLDSVFNMPPVFDYKAYEKVRFDNGKTLELKADQNSAENVFVKEAGVNGSVYTKNYFSHSLLQNGGVVNYKMSPVPNMKRGINQADFPYSLTEENGSK
ncbi:MAG: glycoside hydrolase family 92 protein [Bacteroidia bacterium]|nr:glycoside hydrolase family 92 protein [Bacteroidia bacterium]